MKLRIGAVAVCSLLALAACGGESGDRATSGGAPSTKVETGDARSQEMLLEVGFGQNGSHAIGIEPFPTL